MKNLENKIQRKFPNGSFVRIEDEKLYAKVRGIRDNTESINGINYVKYILNVYKYYGDEGDEWTIVRYFDEAKLTLVSDQNLISDLETNFCKYISSLYSSGLESDREYARNLTGRGCFTAKPYTLTDGGTL